MARHPLRICSKCGKKVRGACLCSKRKYNRPSDRERGSAAKRGYDAKWRRFRGWFLARHPLCSDCNRGATDVHHIVKVRDDPKRRLDPSNCMALCQQCHSTRTAKGE